MTLSELLALLDGCPLVASVQAAENSPVDHPETLGRLASASAQQGVRLLRLQGAANILAAKDATGLPAIGLVKRDYPGSDVYITPTSKEVQDVLGAGAEVVALDGTSRSRPGGEQLSDFIRQIHGAGQLVLADIDTVESAKFAVSAGADILSTTLGGYTDARSTTEGPDLELLRDVVALGDVPVLAEGRFELPWQVDTAIRIGASGVVIGGSLNDPEKNTRRFMPSPKATGTVGAVDIGGTWLRFGIFTSEWDLVEVYRIPLPKTGAERIDWIRAQIEGSQVERVGIGTAGIIDPRTGRVWTAKEHLIPNHVGCEFNSASLGIPAYPHGDGHATAWGHACLPQFAGLRVATLALGTGVGCGFVADGWIWSGRKGEYPRINDLPAPGGSTNEGLLGGLYLTREPSQHQQASAVLALEGAIAALRGLYFPDVIVVAGSVGMSDWLAPHVDRLGATRSPFAHEAGLFGAAALALFPRYM